MHARLYNGSSNNNNQDKKSLQQLLQAMEGYLKGEEKENKELNSLLKHLQKSSFGYADIQGITDKLAESNLVLTSVGRRIATLKKIINEEPITKDDKEFLLLNSDVNPVLFDTVISRYEKISPSLKS